MYILEKGTTMTSNREILVLYGSQTGNSEAAAQEIARLIPEKLTGGPYVCHAMQLDDFLEYKRCHWTPVIIIVTSSYGVGQAPLGCYKFREFCDEIVSAHQKNILHGIHYALLGLGDSKYTTFFQNPTKIEEALQLAGATRFASIGKADASLEQLQIIEDWIQKDLFSVLQETVNSCYKNNEKRKELLESAQKKSYELCLKLFPDWNEQKKNPMNGILISLLLIAIIGVILATILKE